MAAINIDHKNGIISTDKDNLLYVTKNGAIRLGNGIYLDELGNSQEIEPKQEYIGAIRYNNDRTCLQVCDGTSWKDINGQYKSTSNIIWSLIF